MSAPAPSMITDAKLMAATGKTRGEWHALLDAENAATWTHKEMADWLHREHGVGAWWSQAIVVGYEQARGLRIPGQQSDGTLAAGSSKTVDGDLLETLDRVIAAITDHFGPKPERVSHAAKHPSARWRLSDGTGVLATLSPGPLGSVRRCRIALTRTNLPSADLLADAKQELAAILDRFAG